MLMTKKAIRKRRDLAIMLPDRFGDLMMDKPVRDRQAAYAQVRAQVRRNLGLPPEEQKPTPEQVREYLAKRKANA